jgi:hypothetical protein
MRATPEGMLLEQRACPPVVARTHTPALFFLAGDSIIGSRHSRVVATVHCSATHLLFALVGAETGESKRLVVCDVSR